jgi:hypothetical protein
VTQRKRVCLFVWLGLMALLGLISCSSSSPKNEPNGTDTLPGSAAAPSEKNPSEAAIEAQTDYAPIPFNALTVVDQRDIELPEDILPHSLAPNGQWLLASRRGMVCIYETDEFTEQFCQPWLSGIPATSTWSPDSQWVAFTENSKTHFIESDLWVLSSFDGELRNLTDDGFEGSFSIKEGKGEQVDFAPAFSPNSQQVIYARTLMDDAPIKTTDLYQIAIAGGNPQKLATLDPEYPSTISGNLYWSGAHGKILYSLTRPKTSDPQNGIWQIDPTGKHAKHIVESSQDFGPPMVQAVRPQGDQIILAYEYSLFMRLAPPEELIFLFDLTNGDTIPFLAPVEFEVVTARATFAPDGNTILYLLGGEEKFKLVAYDPTNSETKVLLEQNGTIAQPRDNQFSWAENNLVYISMFGPAPDLLIQLAEAE